MLKKSYQLLKTVVLRMDHTWLFFVVAVCMGLPFTVQYIDNLKTKHAHLWHRLWHITCEMSLIQMPNVQVPIAYKMSFSLIATTIKKS